MMKTLIILSALLLLNACDNPQRSRASTSVSGTASDALGTPGSGLTDVTSGTTTGGTTGSTTGAIDTNFPNCDLTTAKYSTNDLGQVAICQSTVDTTMFKFKTSLSSTGRVCLIPTYKDSSTGASTWLGQPQCTITVAGKIYSGKLYKTRANYTAYPLNGVLVMKEALLTEYFACIDAYINFVQTNCPLNPTNAQCVYYANQSRNSLCTAFKTKYPSSYLDLPPSGTSGI